MLLKEPNAFKRAHAEPWDHLQRVPLIFYGSEHVPAVGTVDRPVTLTDVAPTVASHLRFPFEAPDGETLQEAVLPGKSPPRLMVVLVWDSVGWNVLEEHPGTWPVLDRLRGDGVSFERATIGSVPSVTPPVHTTLGTGALPRHHGLVDIYIRNGDRVVPSHADPRNLRVPSLADRFDRAGGNEPLVGVVAERDWHLGMVGHGSSLEGADRDIAVLADEEGTGWAIPGENSRYFELPGYVNDVPGLPESVRELDLEDGALDGTWLGEDLSDPTSLRRTPAHVGWQTRILEELIRREGFGADDVPDLLFTNYKQSDEAAHRWGMESEQMESVVRAEDQALEQLMAFLDRRVGDGRWVLVVTADHGSVPSFELSGGIDVDKVEFQRDFEAEFDDDDGRSVLQQFRPTQLWIDEAELMDNEHALTDVAEWVAAYTLGDNRSQVPDSQRKRRLFKAAFPSEVLEGLSCP